MHRDTGSDPNRSDPNRRRTAAERSGPVLLSVLLACIGTVTLTAGLRSAGPPPQAPHSGSTLVVTHDPLPDQSLTGAPPAPGPVSLTRSRPVRLDIPRIGVHTRLAELGLARDGTLALPPPSASAPAGWYRYLASPGEDGPAVIVGHVDSARDGPAVFYRLGLLGGGDLVDVVRADGVVAHFAVTEVVTVPKARFPSAAVYGPLRYPGLRLITCGGSFDRDSGHYRNNVIVFARLIGATTPAEVRKTTTARP